MRKLMTAAVLAATSVATLLTPAAAQARPGPSVTALLGTFDFGRAAVIGQGGKQTGTWSSYRVRSGFAGDDLTITYRPAVAPLRAEKLVYTAAFNEVKDAQGECRKVGDAGVSRRVWVSYRCQTGIVASYSLLVR